MKKLKTTTGIEIQTLMLTSLSAPSSNKYSRKVSKFIIATAAEQTDIYWPITVFAFLSTSIILAVSECG